MGYMFDSKLLERKKSIFQCLFAEQNACWPLMKSLLGACKYTLISGVLFFVEEF